VEDKKEPPARSSAAPLLGTVAKIKTGNIGKRKPEPNAESPWRT
jgi:hypothetical protein